MEMLSVCNNAFTFSKSEENPPPDEWSDYEIGNVSDDEKESKNDEIKKAKAIERQLASGITREQHKKASKAIRILKALNKK